MRALRIAVRKHLAMETVDFVKLRYAVGWWCWYVFGYCDEAGLPIPYESNFGRPMTLFFLQ